MAYKTIKINREMIGRMLKVLPAKRKPRISQPKGWYSKNRSTVSSKLRQAILDVMPFSTDKKEADLILHAIFDTIKDALCRGEKVVIPRIGRFEVRTRASWEYTAPTGKEYWLPARKSAKFVIHPRFRLTLADEEQDGPSKPS